MADDVELTLVTDVGAQGDGSVEGLLGLPTAAASELSPPQVNPVLATPCVVWAPPIPGVVPGRIIRGMDAPGESADFEESDELQRLRRRAYGPNADIAGDAAAQARLSELEAAQRRERAADVDAAAAPPPRSRNASRSLTLSKGRELHRHRSLSLSTGRPPRISLTEGRSPS